MPGAGAMTDAWDGRPERPERDGWHWLQAKSGDEPECGYWCAEQWRIGTWMQSPWVASKWRYLGPCLTPDEVTAREVAAAEAMREQASKHCAGVAAFLSSPDEICVAMACAVGVGRLPIPAADALARALDQARAEEREVCAEIARAAGAPAVVALIRRNTPAAIRAWGKEANNG